MTDVMEDETADTLPSLFDIAANIQLSIGGLAQKIEDYEKRAVRKEQRELAAKPNYVGFVGNAVLDANGNGIIDFSTPQDGRVWTIRQLMVALNGSESFVSGPTAAVATGTFAAAGAGSVALTQANTSYITGFDVDISAATAAGLSTVTLSGVVGGPITYSVQQETTGGTTLSRRFPGNGLKVNGTPTLTIGATVGGGSGTLNLYGTNVSTTAGVMWYIGTKLTTAVTTQWRWTQYPLPAFDRFTSDSLQLNDNQNLFAVVNGGTPGQVIVAVAVVKDEPRKSFQTVSEV